MAASLYWREMSGRNGWDTPVAIPLHQGIEALNVDLKPNILGSKRLGSATVTLAGDSFTGTNHLSKFVAAQDETAAQLMIVSADATPEISRVTSSNTNVTLTLTDNIASRPQDVSAVTLNGKWFIAYDSAVNRLHVYSPSESTTTVRRTGLATPAAPSVADQGAGTYAATIRYYAIKFRVKSGSTVLRESEYSAATSFTPNATSASARVTKPATISEGETHWVVFGSAESDAGPFYELSEIIVATTTYDDSAAPDTYDDGTNPIGATIGSHFPFPSVKYLATDGVRLFGFGVWETSAGDSLTPVPGRLYFTPPLNARRTDEATTTDGDNEERIQRTADLDDFIDLNTAGGSPDRGIAGPVNGRMFCFQSRGIYMIVPTQSVTSPVRKINISEKLGAVSHLSLVTAEDESGAPALYFLDPKTGPNRLGLGADVQWLGKDVKDIWESVNLSATTVVAHGHYDSAKKQVKWWIATGSSNVPDTMIVFHVALGRSEAVTGDVRGGWAKWTGPLATARHACMFPSTLAATRPLTEVSYGGDASTNLFRQDGTVNQDYGSVSYQAYVEWKAHDLDTGKRKRLQHAFLNAKTQSGTTITHTLVPNFGDQSSITESVSLAAVTASETRVRKRIFVDVSNLMAFSIRLGDSAAANNTWLLDRYEAMATAQDDMS